MALADNNLAVGQDAADAALYIAQATAVANLPAGAVDVEQAADAQYAGAVRDRDTQLAADAAAQVKRVAAAWQQYSTQQISAQNYDSAVAAAAQTRATADQQANAAFNTAISSAAHQAQVNLGPVRQVYVDQVYSARVQYVTDSNAAQEHYAAATAGADVQLTTDMAQSDYFHQRDTLAADNAQTTSDERCRSPCKRCCPPST